MKEINCTSGKVIYPSLKVARTAGILCRNLDGGDRLRAYYCPICGYYHLTSHHSTENHEIYKNGHKYDRNKNKWITDLNKIAI